MHAAPTISRSGTTGGGSRLKSSAGERARLAIDIGGTFTDVVVERGGHRATAKVLTTSAAPEQGVIAGLEAALGGADLVPGDIGLVIHGTTLATNALIERKGAVTALVTTEGFRDVLDIGYEDRYDQYDVFIDKPRPLVPRYLRLPVGERVRVDGEVLAPLDEGAVAALAPVLAEHGVESVAIAFLHSYANGAHEARAREILSAALPEISITLSSEVSPEVREYERFTTASANAYVQPLMARYLSRLEAELAARGVAAPIFLMTSGGGLTTLETAIRFPVRLVESGPAGGAILAAHIAAECGLDRVLSFDMGGTTAKICLIEEHRPQTARAFEVGRAARFLKGSGLPLRIPVIEMVEIGAGGGSIARLDEMERIAVGPESAGSEPGPACYGLGGEAATVTDADVALGRIDPARFAGGRMRLDRGRAEQALRRAIGEGLGLATPMAAFGVAEMVDETMANAARVHAIERGKTIADFTMVAFGGAAPLHACRLADKLELDRILVPTHAGVGSAIGFLRAPVAYEVVRSRYMRLGGFDFGLANEVLDAMHDEALAVVRAGAPEEELVERRSAFMRYVGQGHEIEVPLPNRPLVADDAAQLQESFDGEYAAMFSRVIPGADVEVLSWTLTLGTVGAAPERVDRPVGEGASGAAGAAPGADGEREVFDAEDGQFTNVPVYVRDGLSPGARVAGPALIVEDQTSIYVTGEFDGRVMANGYIMLQRRGAGQNAGEA